jgi:hypothetical protein
VMESHVIANIAYSGHVAAFRDTTSDTVYA